MNKKVIKFAELMQQELENNSHKGDWETFNHEKMILSEFEHHFKKILVVLESKESIYFDLLLKEHIADCANILMFLGNTYELYD